MRCLVFLCVLVCCQIIACKTCISPEILGKRYNLTSISYSPSGPVPRGYSGSNGATYYSWNFCDSVSHLEKNCLQDNSNSGACVFETDPYSVFSGGDVSKMEWALSDEKISVIYPSGGNCNYTTQIVVRCGDTIEPSFYSVNKPSSCNSVIEIVADAGCPVMGASSCYPISIEIPESGYLTVLGTLDGAFESTNPCTNENIATVWYKIEPSVAFNVNISVSSASSLSYSLLNGSCEHLQCVSELQSSSSEFFSFKSGKSPYWLAISGDNGSFDLNIEVSDTPIGCINAVPVNLYYPVYIEAILGTNVYEGNTICGISGNQYVDWYSVYNSYASSLTVSTCGSNASTTTSISVFSGTCDQLECEGYTTTNCFPYGATIDVDVDSGKQYYVAVYGDYGYYQIAFSW